MNSLRKGPQARRHSDDVTLTHHSVRCWSEAGDKPVEMVPASLHAWKYIILFTALFLT